MPLAQPPGLDLYPWQAEYADRIRRDGACVAAARPGAGKTHAALAAAAVCDSARIVIVAPPGRVCRQWLSAAAAWGADAHLVGGKGQGGPALASAATALLADASIAVPTAVVVPWSRLRRQADAAPLLSAFNAITASDGPCIDLLIVDESHYAQGAEEVQGGRALLGYNDSRKHKTFRGLASCAMRVAALTGTPVTSKPNRIRAQLLLARIGAPRHGCPELVNRYTYEGKWWAGKMQYSYAARRQIWTCADRAAPGHERLVSAGLLMVDDAALRLQLPAHRRVLVTGWEEGAVPAELDAWSAARQAGAATGGIPALEVIADVRRDATAARAQDIAAVVASWHGEAPARRMLLVWTVYQESTETLAAVIGKALTASDDATSASSAVCALHGGMTASARLDVLRRAMAGEVRCLVATHASTGVGVDGLQHVADRALVAEAPWTPGEAEQSEGRLFRTGQPNPVLTEWIFAGCEAAIIRGIGIHASAIAAVLDAATPVPAAPNTPPAVLDISPAGPDRVQWSWRRTPDGGWGVVCMHPGDDTWLGRTVKVRSASGTVSTCRLIARAASSLTHSVWHVRVER